MLNIVRYDIPRTGGAEVPPHRFQLTNVLVPVMLTRVSSPLPLHFFHPIQSSFDCSNIIRYLNLAARPVETASRDFFSMRRF
jgi:hypothetical protein